MATTVTQTEFSAKKAEGFNRIPVARTVLADAETPLSAYAKLAQSPRSFLFESVEGGERWGRYSIIGLPAKTWLTFEGYRLSLFESGERIESRDAATGVERFEQFRAGGRGRLLAILRGCGRGQKAGNHDRAGDELASLPHFLLFRLLIGPQRINHPAPMWETVLAAGRNLPPMSGRGAMAMRCGSGMKDV